MVAVGIDAAPGVPLPVGVLDLVARSEELDRLARLPAGPACWDTLLFSAKESVFKAWQPLTGRPLDFAEASVTLEPASRHFTVTLLPGGGSLPGAPRRLVGRWVARGPLLATAVVVFR